MQKCEQSRAPNVSTSTCEWGRPGMTRENGCTENREKLLPNWKRLFRLKMPPRGDACGKRWFSIDRLVTDRHTSSHMPSHIHKYTHTHTHTHRERERLADTTCTLVMSQPNSVVQMRKLLSNFWQSISCLALLYLQLGQNWMCLFALVMHTRTNTSL